jgi:hypothetical protein
MQNVIILGSGRSGTSMVAGTLSKGGYHMGDNLLPANESNPKGFFEDIKINEINEAILAQIVSKRPPVLGRWFFRHRPLPWQRWLACVPLNKKLKSTHDIDQRIKLAIYKTPFCFKDPRFSYTLPIWRPFLENTVFICVFRHPTATATSILKECKDDVRLHSLAMNLQRALEVWTLMYKHIIEIHRKTGKWLFLHYNQVLKPEGMDKIASFTCAKIDRSFPEESLLRVRSNNAIPSEVQNVYDTLCKLSKY